ncbi:hypothetical protein QJQ45_024667, partial [Haematococcus lacustris]
FPTFVCAVSADIAMAHFMSFRSLMTPVGAPRSVAVFAAKAATKAAKPATSVAAPAEAKPAAKVKAIAKPVKIKRAPSPINLFYKDKYAEARASVEKKGGNPKSLVECNKVLQEMWVATPDNVKSQYTSRSDKAKEEMQQQRAAAKGPVRPPTSYMAYWSTQYPALKKKHPEMKVTEIAKLAAQQWRSLPQDEKDKINAASKAAMDKFKSGAATAPAVAPSSNGAAAPAAKAAPAPAPKAAAAPAATAPAAAPVAPAAAPVAPATAPVPAAAPATPASLSPTGTARARSSTPSKPTTGSKTGRRSPTPMNKQ